MKKTPERFYTDVGTFEGEGLELQPKKNRRSMDELFDVGTIVRIKGFEQNVEIERVWPIFEKVLYDYSGIIEMDGVKKRLYFNHDEVVGRAE
ncbi:MAG: hypothetical protein IJO51_07580 [Clostridia bacterium]|nr:hypothetical protein [Clostridia bacterium]